MKLVDQLLFSASGQLRCRFITRTNEPYMERYYVGKVLGLTVFLHRFVDADGDLDIHDHPWNHSVAFVLNGGYAEERMLWLDPDTGPKVKLRNIRRGLPNVIRAGDFHRIAHIKPGTWTLFIHGQKVKRWGFYHAEPGKVTYSQPNDVESTKGWYRHAPKGKDADRVPLGQFRSAA